MRFLVKLAVAHVVERYVGWRDYHRRIADEQFIIYRSFYLRDRSTDPEAFQKSIGDFDYGYGRLDDEAYHPAFLFVGEGRDGS